MRQFWNRIGTPDAISWFSVAVVTLLQFSGTFIASGINYTGRLVEFSTVVLLALLPPILILLIGKLLLLRFASIRPRPVLVLSIFATAFLSRAVIIDFLLIQAEFLSSPQIVYRLASSTFTFGAGLVITAYFVSTSREYSRSANKLSKTLLEVVDLRSSAVANLERRSEELIQNVKSELINRLEDVSGEVPERDLHSLKAMIDDFVRPVSFRLSFSQPQLVKVLSANLPDSKIRWIDVVNQNMMRNPFHPGSLTGLTLLLSAIPYITLFGFGLAAPSILLTITLGYLVLSGAKFVWRLLPKRVGLLQRGALFSAVMAVFAVAEMHLLNVVFGISYFLDLAFIPSILIVVIIAWIASLVITVTRIQDETLIRLRDETYELRLELVRQNTAFRALQKSVARALHGPVQDSVSLAAIRMQMAIDEGKATSSLVPKLRGTIVQTLEALEKNDTIQIDVQKSLSELSELWDGVALINVDIDVDYLGIQSEHPESASSVLEVVREACSNAIRHGSASEVLVVVRLIGSGQLIEVNVANNGKQLPLISKLGQGSSMLDELTVEWTRKMVDDRPTLRAIMPL